MSPSTESSPQVQRSGSHKRADRKTLLDRLFPERPETLRYRDVAWALVAFSVGLAAVSYLLGLVIEKTPLKPPPPTFEVLSEKLDFVTGRGDEFDLYLVGSSRVYRGLDPAIIDEELAKRGKPLRSLNLGVQALSLLEEEAILQHVVAETAPPRTTRAPTILIEPTPVLVRIRNWPTERARAFNHFDDMADNLRFLAGVPDYTERGFRLKSIAALLLGLGAKAVNFGSGSRLFFPDENEFRLRQLSDPLMASGLGYRPREVETSEFLEQLEREFRTRLGETGILEIGGKRPAMKLSSAEIDRLVRLISEVENAGHRVVLVIAPDLKPTPWLPDLVHALGGHLPHIPILDYSYQTQSELYEDEELWFDRSHLSQLGARRWSRMLAADVAEHLP